MILTTFIALTALGLVLWGVGYYLEFTGIASIGAVMVIAAGGMVVVGGLQVQSGETLQMEYMDVDGNTTDSNATFVNNETTVTYQYREVSTPQRIQLGALVLITGGLLFTRTLGQVGGV